MSQFGVNAQRFNPYERFRFRIKWDGRTVAGISAVGLSKPNTEGVEHRAVGDPSTSRNRPVCTQFGAITLERGITHDQEFARWANTARDFGSIAGAEVSLPDFRKDLTIDVYDETGQRAMAYKVFCCWVSEYQALPDLDAHAKAVTIQTIKLEHEGWERDDDVTEPSEPHTTDPPDRHA